MLQPYVFLWMHNAEVSQSFLKLVDAINCVSKVFVSGKEYNELEQ